MFSYLPFSDHFLQSICLRIVPTAHTQPSPGQTIGFHSPFYTPSWPWDIWALLIKISQFFPKITLIFTLLCLYLSKCESGKDSEACPKLALSCNRLDYCPGLRQNMGRKQRVVLSLPEEPVFILLTAENTHFYLKGPDYAICLALAVFDLVVHMRSLFSTHEYIQKDREDN